MEAWLETQWQRFGKWLFKGVMPPRWDRQEELFKRATTILREATRQIKQLTPIIEETAEAVCQFAEAYREADAKRH